MMETALRIENIRLIGLISHIDVFYENQILWLQPGRFLIFLQIQPQMFLKYFLNS